jgi:hypothetical protein
LFLEETRFLSPLRLSRFNVAHHLNTFGRPRELRFVGQKRG